MSRCTPYRGAVTMCRVTKCRGAVTMCQLYLSKTEKNLPFVVSVVISMKDVKTIYVILVINLFRPQLRTQEDSLTYETESLCDT